MSSKDRLHDEYESQQGVTAENQAFFDDSSAALGLGYTIREGHGIKAWDLAEDRRLKALEARKKELGADALRSVNTGAHTDLAACLDAGYTLAQALELTALSEHEVMDAEPVRREVISDRDLKPGYTIVKGGGSSNKGRASAKSGRPLCEDCHLETCLEGCPCVTRRRCAVCQRRRGPYKHGRDLRPHIVTGRVSARAKEAIEGDDLANAGEILEAAGQLMAAGVPWEVIIARMGLSASDVRAA
jgi:hypothetical protein